MLDRRPLGNILVAIDFSAGAKRALERATRLPITPGATLTLLHVMPKLHPSLFAHAEQAARAALEEWAQEVRAQVPPNVDVLVAVETGEASVEIIHRAEGERAELVVLGRHGRRRWPGDVLGTTAEHVVRRAHAAVLLVVDTPQESYRRPLVAVDQEGSASAAIEMMARTVAPEVRGALAIHVLDPDALSLLTQYDLTDQEVDRHQRWYTEETRPKIELALDEIGGTELDFDVRFVEGPPREAILQSARAEAADLIAVGTHGRSGLRHLLFGSVAEAVVRRADIDVLVARAATT